MRKLTPIELKPWTLPFLVLALVLPIAGATLLIGSVGGFIAGALVATAVLVLAARARFDEPIEVSAASDRRYHVLVVALEPVEEARIVTALEGARTDASRLIGEGAGVELLVLAPARIRTLDRWASDLGEARQAAQRRLAISLATLAAAGLEARGEIGDDDPVQAVEDALREFPAHEAAFVTAAGEGEREVSEVRRRLDRPVRHLVAGAPAGAPSAGGSGPLREAR